MHEASFEKMRAFKDAYLSSPTSARPRVLDVGSGGERLSYRSLFPAPDYLYVGLDIEHGRNVDFVPADPFSWDELDTDSFDVIVSGQMLEHNPYFWITLAEMARVVTEGGLIAVIAPSTGHVHRYPLDCWRFYPDSWAAMCAFVGLELLEGFREGMSWRKTIPGTYWRDAMMVARKPDLSDDELRKAFYSRLETIVSLRLLAPDAATRPGRGIAAKRYERTHTLPIHQVAWRPARLAAFIRRQVLRLRETRFPLAVRRRMWAWDGRRAIARGDEHVAP